MNMILFEKMPCENRIPMDDFRAKHIVEVLKLAEGDSFKMGIVNESEGTAVVRTMDEAFIGIDYTPVCEPEGYPVTMIIAQVRPICMKRILRDVVSLGVSRIILTGTDTGEKSYMKSNLYTTGEYRDFLLDGAMQSAHAFVPEVLFADNVQAAVRLAGEDANLIVLDNVHSQGSLSSLSLCPESETVLAIGPERGWSDRERNYFERMGYTAMLLGSRVLRTETACTAGLSVLLADMGLV